jgi:two-component system, NarL family, sensor histidine kinase UhpB
MATDNYSLSVWIIEDNPGDAFLLQELLISSGFSSAKVTTFNSLKEAISTDVSLPDVVLLDLFLSDSNGLDGYKKFVTLYPGLPVIILSGLSAMEVALEAVKLGAQDFLVKDELEQQVLIKSIHYSIERKKSLDNIISSESKYRLLFGASPLPHFLLDENLMILDANLAASQLYKKDFLKQQVEFASFLENQQDAQYVYESIKNEIAIKSRHLTESGELLYVEIVSNKLFFEGRLNYIVMINDETDKFLLEEQKLRLIHDTEDRERERFSRELHDGLAQHMVALGLYLNQLSPSTEADQELIQGCKEIVRTSLDQTRAMCYNLTPPELEYGLVSGIQAMFNRLSKITSIAFELSCDKKLDKFIQKMVHEYPVYRIIQEFVNNSIKHANCSLIKCTFMKLSSGIEIEVSDNGQGYDSNSIETGLGLKNMRQRALAAGIDLQLKSKPGNGANLNLFIPF